MDEFRISRTTYRTEFFHSLIRRYTFLLVFLINYTSQINRRGSNLSTDCHWNIGHDHFKNHTWPDRSCMQHSSGYKSNSLKTFRSRGLKHMKTFTFLPAAATLVFVVIT